MCYMHLFPPLFPLILCRVNLQAAAHYSAANYSSASGTPSLKSPITV